MKLLTPALVLAVGLVACGGPIDPASPSQVSHTVPAVSSTAATESEVQVTVPETSPAASTTIDPEIEQAAVELEEALGELESLLDDMESLLEAEVD